MEADERLCHLDINGTLHGVLLSSNGIQRQ